MNSYPQIIQKIMENSDKFVIFYTPNCVYSVNALNLLREANVGYKGYDINNINGGISRLLKTFNDFSDEIQFNPQHRTRPIVFYQGKYLGGYQELNDFLNQPHDQ